jgi:Regulator of Vps4 activity in the MVB pathway
MIDTLCTHYGVLVAHKRSCIGSRLHARARVRAQVMNIERSREAMALVEVYLGLVQQRVEQIKRDKALPPELRTAVTSIVHAANRMESVPELRALRKTFERKWGAKELKAAAGEDEATDPVVAGVAEKLMLCVNPGPPRPNDWVRKGVAIAEEQKVEGVQEEQLYEVGDEVLRSAALQCSKPSSHGSAEWTCHHAFGCKRSTVVQ